MSSNGIALSVRGLGKSYTIVHDQEKHITLAETILSRLKNPFRRLRTETFWALKDISFDINKGDVVGIIGRNGAGKSTLLKVLSRITYPTSGEVDVYGRVGSLLEVGTGFHPELTGRENIFLNGAILGMTKADIKAHFDAIVEFAGVEQFLDTPVKRYSSGMYVRLAFAVAAHLEPEILIVDEVLAVGDAAFQKKCIGKMSDVAKTGRTVLFVSHNMGAVRSLCQQGIFLNAGRIAHAGPIEDVIQSYVGDSQPESSAYVAAKSSNWPHFQKIDIQQGGEERAVVAIDQPITLNFQIENCGVKDLALGVLIRNIHGQCIHHLSDEFCPDPQIANARRRTCVLPAYSLAAGAYQVDVSLDKRNYENYDRAEACLRFQVEFSGVMSDRTLGSSWKGVCGPGLATWSHGAQTDQPNQ